MSTRRSKMTPRELITKARINLMTDHPFFGSLAMKLVIRELSKEEVEKFGVKTAAIDIYGNLMYNPEWIATLDDATVKFVVAHEVMHVALKHLYRIGSRRPDAWNIATDSADNDILKGTFQIPKQCVHFDKMSGKSAEEIYDWYIKNAKVIQVPAGGWDKHIYEEKQDKDNKNGGGQGKSPFYKPGQEPVDVPRAIKEAYNFAKSQGKLPAGIARQFADILEPVMDWKEILRKFIVQVIPHDFTYTYPSKKSYSCGFYMPKVLREHIELCIAVDTSGSISDKEYEEFLSEVYFMCRQFECLKATVIFCDAAISEVMEIDENFDPTVVKSRGYGGTSSLPVFKYIKDEKQDTIKILLYFTDGFIDIPDKVPPYPTLWIISENGSPETVEKMDGAQVIKMPKRIEDGQRDDY